MTKEASDHSPLQAEPQKQQAASETSRERHFQDYLPREQSPDFIPGGSYRKGIYPALDRELASMEKYGLRPAEKDEGANE